ncbi:enoyl-CoA hydratase/isomerase family protein [Nonomuraea sp. K274]|uniref:Enoyl-CoA hydratase/isomerase family protein n=1 Tax=Nonomuraea cypriaca TaxID=1187855 RepID=A0A931EXR6_9ACTN|nr:enoyl-CoA hydratase/isomerase family protein [Nonomuraea cypriaca]MBF8188029.1 enoyl-CoA hydratase/isomerase family protein [Nonomuraea cypriaca]
MSEPVDVTVRHHVAKVRLNRPEVLNAVDGAALAEFGLALRDCADSSDVHAVVIHGAGRSFCSGIDLTALATGRIPLEWFDDWERAVALCEEMPKPVICAIHGHCLGGGFQIALACDARVASPDAVFELPAIREGLIPGFGVHRLPRYVGVALTRRMVLFGDRWTAARAAELGVLDQVSPDPLAAAVEMASEMAPLSQVRSFAVCKRLLSLAGAGADPLQEYLARQAECLGSEDHRASAEAWLSR